MPNLPVQYARLLAHAHSPCCCLQAELIGLEAQRDDAGALQARVAELAEVTSHRHELQLQLTDMEAAAAEVGLQVHVCVGGVLCVLCVCVVCVFSGQSEGSHGA